MYTDLYSFKSGENNKHVVTFIIFQNKKSISKVFVRHP